MLRDTAHAAARKQCPPSLVRAHIDDPAAADPLWDAPARVGRARRRAARRSLPVPRGVRRGARARAVLLHGRARPAADARCGTRPRRRSRRASPPPRSRSPGADGDMGANDEPTKTFVLEADRVDHVLVVDGNGRVEPLPGRVATSASVGSIDSTRRIFEVETSSEIAATRHRSTSSAGCSAPRSHWRPRWSAPLGGCSTTAIE